MRTGVDGFDLLFVGVEGGDFFLDAGGGVVLELGVVLVQTILCADGWGEVEVDVGEVLVGEEAEGLDGTVGGEALGLGGGGEQECSEEGGEGELVDTHVICWQCKTRTGQFGKRIDRALAGTDFLGLRPRLV